MTYLDIKKGDFYKIETTVDGKSYVTARGWTDLSNMIKLLERKNIKVDETLVSQYLRHRKIAKDFSVYYDLFNKYKSDYQIIDIVSGKADSTIKQRAKNARFDERLSLLGLMLDTVNNRFRKNYCNESALLEYKNILKNAFSKKSGNIYEIFMEEAENCREKLETVKRASGISADEKDSLHMTISFLEELAKTVKEKPDAKSAVKSDFKKRKDSMLKNAKEISSALDNIFGFCEEVFGDGQEMIILVTELSVNYYSSHFIRRYGCEKYHRHNKEMMFHERHREITAEILELNIDEDF